MPLDALPATALEMIPSELFLGLSKTDLHSRAGEVSDLIAPGRLTGHTRAPSPPTDTATERVFSQYPGLSQPNTKIGRHFANKSLLPLVEPIKEVCIPAIGFVKSPRFDPDAVLQRLINQGQSDLRFCQKANVIGDVVFFAAQDRGSSARADTFEQQQDSGRTGAHRTERQRRRRFRSCHWTGIMIPNSGQTQTNTSLQSSGSISKAFLLFTLVAAVHLTGCATVVSEKRYPITIANSQSPTFFSVHDRKN
jgi:hypothetical protein